MHHILALELIYEQAHTLTEQDEVVQQCARAVGCSAYSLLAKARALKHAPLQQREDTLFPTQTPMAYINCPRPKGFARRDGWYAGGIDERGARAAEVPASMRPGQSVRQYVEEVPSTVIGLRYEDKGVVK